MIEHGQTRLLERRWEAYTARLGYFKAANRLYLNHQLRAAQKPVYLGLPANQVFLGKVPKITVTRSPQRGPLQRWILVSEHGKLKEYFLGPVSKASDQFVVLEQRTMQFASDDDLQWMVSDDLQWVVPIEEIALYHDQNEDIADFQLVKPGSYLITENKFLETIGPLSTSGLVGQRSANQVISVNDVNSLPVSHFTSINYSRELDPLDLLVSRVRTTAMRSQGPVKVLMSTDEEREVLESALEENLIRNVRNRVKIARFDAYLATAYGRARNLNAWLMSLDLSSTNSPDVRSIIKAVRRFRKTYGNQSMRYGLRAYHHGPGRGLRGANEAATNCQKESKEYEMALRVLDATSSRQIFEHIIVHDEHGIDLAGWVQLSLLGKLKGLCVVKGVGYPDIRRQRVDDTEIAAVFGLSRAGRGVVPNPISRQIHQFIEREFKYIIDSPPTRQGPVPLVHAVSPSDLARAALFHAENDVRGIESVIISANASDICAEAIGLGWANEGNRYVRDGRVSRIIEPGSNWVDLDHLILVEPMEILAVADWLGLCKEMTRTAKKLTVVESMGLPTSVH